MSTHVTKVRSKREQTGEMVAYSETAMRHNGAILEYSRTSISALSGCAAGILGLTAQWGFLFYFVIALVLWIMFIVRTASKWQRYLRSRWTFLTNGLFGGLFTYILFWTLFYGIVHVY